MHTRFIPNDIYFQVVSRATTLAAGDTLMGDASIDNSIGRETVFVFAYTADQPPDVTLKSPTGVVYNDKSSAYILNTNFKIIRFRLSGIAEVSHVIIDSVNNMTVIFPKKSIKYITLYVQYPARMSEL